MNPFNNNLPNQYFSNLFPSSAYYPAPFLFYSEEPVPMWNPPGFSDGYPGQI